MAVEHTGEPEQVGEWLDLVPRRTGVHGRVDPLVEAHPQVGDRPPGRTGEQLGHLGEREQVGAGQLERATRPRAPSSAPAATA